MQPSNYVLQKEPSFHQHAGRERPISAPKEKGDYDKYHEYLNHLEQGIKCVVVFVQSLKLIISYCNLHVL